MPYRSAGSYNEISTMPEEKKSTEIETLLSDEKSLEGRKKSLIDALLKERAAAIADFDEKLAKLGYKANFDKSKRSHHKKSGTAASTAKPKTPTPPSGDGGKITTSTVPRRRR